MSGWNVRCVLIFIFATIQLVEVINLPIGKGADDVIAIKCLYCFWLAVSVIAFSCVKSK